MKIELVGQAAGLYKGKERLPTADWAELEADLWGTLELLRQEKLPLPEAGGAPGPFALYARDLGPYLAGCADLRELPVKVSSGGKCAVLAGKVLGPDRIRIHRILLL
jgi:hypothetical protein